MSMSEMKTQFFAQMKERICKTTSSSTSSPLNSSTEPSSGSEKENSEEELEAPKTCPQVTSQVPQLTWYTRGSGNLAGCREVRFPNSFGTHEGRGTWLGAERCRHPGRCQRRPDGMINWSAKSKKEKFVRTCVELSCTGPYILTFEFYFSLAWLSGDFSFGELQWIDRVEELQKNSFWAEKET